MGVRVFMSDYYIFIDLQPEQIGNLVLFVRLLTQRMRMAIPSSQVIWYDSVTINGDLTWQNELNDLNR